MTAERQDRGPLDAVVTASDICKQMQKMLGYVPLGTRDLLNVLAHPDLIEQTRHFLDHSEQELQPSPRGGYPAVPDE